MKTFKQLTEELEHEYYHVTPTKNVKSIMKNGLHPKIGASSAKAGEDKPRTYLFKHHHDAENAVSNWMGDEHHEDTKLALLKVKVAKHKVSNHPDAGWEHSTEHHIHPSKIEVVSKDF